ncbi:MAG: hypothetical protein KME21_30670 [Desmonostoc vinosum HA7617-LM4]|jgi:CHAD domain-containing protein|nr:hypothetical protein [Desmonostoc vinosum HA7617-LM4]
MYHYSQASLNQKSLPQLKEIYGQVGASIEIADKRCKGAWLEAIIAHQSSQVEKVADVVEQPTTQAEQAEVTINDSTISAWDFTPPKWACPPGAICPDCDGHGCGNCGYRGTRGEDLCTPVDEYRFIYAAATKTQTAYSAYIGDKFLGIVFKVRNQEEFWENTQQSYYWECGIAGRFWSVRDAIEALQKRNTPSVAETPVNEEQDATREHKAATIEVLEQYGDKYVVQNQENGNCYVVRLNELDPHQRCECLDCYHRGVKCKHQIAVENFVNAQRLEKLVKGASTDLVEQHCDGITIHNSENGYEYLVLVEGLEIHQNIASFNSINSTAQINLEKLLDKPFEELTTEEWRLLKEYEPQSSESLVAA